VELNIIIYFLISTFFKIFKIFKQNATNLHYELLSSNLSFDTINKEFSFLSPKYRKPHSNKRSASYNASKFIIYLFLASNF